MTMGQSVIQRVVLGVLLTCVTSASLGGQTVRVLSWNVSDSAWVKQAEASRAVLRHANPDVVVLVQVNRFIDDAGIRHMLSGLRGPSDTTWFISSGNSSGVEHTVIASRDSLRALAEFADVPFPTIGALALRGAVPDSAHGVDATPGVRTNAAMVRVQGRWLMVVGVHLTCCGGTDTWREQRRQLGAMTIAARVRSVLPRERPAGVIMAGDLNLVGGRASLDTLLAAVVARPLGPMRRAEALHLDGWTDWTWDGLGSAFNGGRLDNIIYSAGSLDVRRALVLDTEDMSVDSLRVHQLATGTSRSINRHRPVVVDFTFAR